MVASGSPDPQASARVQVAQSIGQLQTVLERTMADAALTDDGVTVRVVPTEEQLQIYIEIDTSLCAQQVRYVGFDQLGLTPA